MSVFNLGIFSAPRFSSFPWSHGNRISMDAGKIHVLASEYLDTGEKFDLQSVGNITRVAPMKAPTLDTYHTDIYAFAVRLRTLGMASRNPWVYEDFFNLNRNANGAKELPSIPLELLIGINKCRNNTLFENFGLPTYKKLREDYLQFLRSNCPWVFDPVVNVVHTRLDVSDSHTYTFGFIPSSFLPNNERQYSKFPYLTSEYFYTESESGDANHFPYIFSLVPYLIDKYPSLRYYLLPLGSNFDTLLNLPDFSIETLVSERSDSLDNLVDTYPDSINVLDWLYEHEKVDAVTVMNDFIENCLLENLWKLSTDGDISYDTQSYGMCVAVCFNAVSLGHQLLVNAFNEFPDLRQTTVPFLGAQPISLRLIPTYFFDAYFKIVADWFINTAITDPDDYFLSATRFLHPVDSVSGEPRNWFNVFNNVGNTQQLKGDIDALMSTRGFAMRYWKNDYFTSCFPSPQAGQAVGIPVNGTIVDLRNANAMQKLKERLLYAGMRFRDVLYSITGKKTSSAIMDMSEVLGAWSNNINVDSVLQQSASENGQPLANYAGTALGYRSGGKGAFYVAEEPTVIIFVASITPKASYFQGLHRKFTRDNIYDYDIPQLANVGEEIVRKSELYLDGDSTGTDTIFGYQRRNGSFMWTPDEVHGDFRGDLDFWHNSRMFGSRPALDEGFLQVNPDDDNLNRVFAVTSDEVNHFYCHFTFVGQVIRHLPKHVVYDL